MDAQIKKGILDMCILHIISKQDIYGYDIMKQMSAFFPEVNDSTFYAILRRLHKDKLTEVYWGKDSNGPPRKYYRITETGWNSLKEDINNWKKLIQIVSSMGI
jgi:PadR family transcriptional regulator PadR